MTAAVKAWTGKTFLLWICGFFAVVFVANAVFLWLATDTWTGLAAENSYRKGVDFNQTLKRAASQRALGWTVETEFVSQGAAKGILRIFVSEADGVPINGREVSADFRRPVVEGLDFSSPLRAVGDGEYRAEIEFPAAGQWDVRLEISRPDSQPYLVETRIWPK